MNLKNYESKNRAHVYFRQPFFSINSIEFSNLVDLVEFLGAAIF